MSDVKRMTSGDVDSVRFHAHRFSEGYDIDEVDDLLDACADTIETLAKELESIVKAKAENK